MREVIHNNSAPASPALSPANTRFELALRRLAECGRTRGNFFEAMIRALSDATGAKIVFIGELAGTHAMRGIAFLIEGKPGPDIVYDLAGTPCEHVIQKGTFFQRTGLQKKFPADEFLKTYKLDSYLGTALKDVDGNVTGLISILNDKPLDTDLRPEFLVELFAGRVSAELERERAARALRQNEERFSLFMQHVPGAAWMKDLDGRYVYINAEAERIFGKTRQQLIGLTDDEIFPPEIATQFKANDRRAVSEGRRIQTIETLPQSDGVHYSVVSKFPIATAAGKFNMVGGIAIDVTERRAAEQALLHTERRFRLALSSNALIVYEQDEQLRYQWLYPPIPAALGKTDKELAQAEDAEELFRAKSEVLRTGTPIRREFFVRRGELEQYFDLIIEPRRDDSGRITGVGGVALDITERKQAELALKRSEARYRALVDASSQAVWVWDPLTGSGNFAHVQQWWQQLTGQPPEAQQGEGWFSAIHAADRETAREAWLKTLQHGAPLDVEYRVHRADGDVAYVHSRAVAIKDAHGRVAELVGTLTDVTSRRRAEEDLRTSERMYRGIGETINYGVWVCDPEGRNTYASPSFLALVGLTQKQCSDAGWKDVLHPDDAEATMAAWKKCAATGQSWERTHRFRGVDGRWHYILARGVPIRDAAGKIQCWAGINLDVDELKQTEEALRASDERFKIATEAGRVGTWEWDIVSGRVIWSDLLAQMHGVKPSDFGGTLQDFEQVLHPDERPRVSAEIKAALQTGTEYTLEFQAHGPDGNGAPYRWFWAKARIIRNAHGEPTRMIGATMDISERRRAEESLRRHAEQLAEIDRRKDEFIAMLAHELRNPLGPIRNGVHLLQHANLDEASAGRVRSMIDRQTTHMSRIVDDLLDMSRVSRGKIVLRKEALDFAQVARELCSDYRHDFDAAGVALKLEIPEAPQWVCGDRTRLAQAFGNLLHNAAKFSPKGGSVVVQMKAADGELVLSVRDNGIGIDPPLLRTLFEPFAQGSQPLDRGRGGLGLGLALAKGLVDLHGGTVTVHSEGLGRGAEFTIRVPLAPPPAPDCSPSNGRAQTEPRRVLIVEDNQDAAESLQMLLSLAGHTVELASTGSAAITKAQSWAPDIIICDIGLPELDGYSVCRTLRPQLAKTKWVALSGYGQSEDQRRAAAAGFDLHLTKPVDPDKLERVVAELLR